MFLFDGYNILWAFSKAVMDAGEITDTKLCRLLSSYLAVIGQDGIVVFDGIGPPDKTGLTSTRNLEVIFSGPHTDADTIIERKIELDTAPKRLNVVSSDNRIREAARARKAFSIKAEQFWLDLQKRLNRKNKIQEPREKTDGLDQGQTDQWMKYFGMQD